MALRNNFRGTKKFLIAKFDCTNISCWLLKLESEPSRYVDQKSAKKDTYWNITTHFPNFLLNIDFYQLNPQIIVSIMLRFQCSSPKSRRTKDQMRWEKVCFIKEKRGCLCLTCFLKLKSTCISTEITWQDIPHSGDKYRVNCAWILGTVESPKLLNSYLHSISYKLIDAKLKGKPKRFYCFDPLKVEIQ